MVERSASIEVLDIDLTKRGLLQALNQHGGHPDNG